MKDLLPDHYYKSKNNKGPSMQPWGTPVSTFFYVEDCPLRTTRSFLSVKKSPKWFSKFPNTSFWLSLNMIPSCYTLSNTFEMLMKTLLTSKPSLKKLYIWQVKDDSRSTQKSPCIKTRLTWRNKEMKRFIKH